MCVYIKGERWSTLISSSVSMELLPVMLCLWPQRRPLFLHMEQEMLRQLQHSMELMERLHQRIFEELDHSSSSTSFLPISFQYVNDDSRMFGVNLNTAEFNPEELMVQQVGRRLRVSGRSERKREDGKGLSSYKCQEFRQEVDLPRGIDPENVSCSLVDGRLQIHAHRQGALMDGKERIVPITVMSSPPKTPITSSEDPQKDTM